MRKSRTGDAIENKINNKRECVASIILRNIELGLLQCKLRWASKFRL